MSRMSIKHTGTHTPSRIPRKGTMCVLRHTRPTFGELDMICLMAGSPDPGSFSLILAPSSPPPRFTCASNTVINGSDVELVTTQRKNRRWHRYYFITLFIYTQLDGTDTGPSTRIY